MLAAIYNGAQFFVPADQVVGHAFHFVPGEDSPEYREDVYPQDFVKALLATIAQGQMLEGDLEPDDGVWNYSILRATLRIRSAPRTLVGRSSGTAGLGSIRPPFAVPSLPPLDGYEFGLV